VEKLKGVFSAIVTPFKVGEVDYQSLEKLVAAQRAAGVDGFVVNGTTGENPTLRENEIKNIFNHLRKMDSKMTLIVGAGSNSTEHALHLTKIAEELKADAALSVVPYYNKPPQRGLLAHFKYIADRVNLPILLYDVPGRTITSFAPQTVGELSQHKNIVGIKEASGKMDVLAEIKKNVNSDFVLLSGDDGTYLDFLKNGGHGVISVASHILPREFVRWTKEAKNNHFHTSEEELKTLKPLIDLLFCEANPIPIKKAVQIMGLIESAELRLPLVELSNEWTEKLRMEMKKQGLIR